MEIKTMNNQYILDFTKQYESFMQELLFFIGTHR